MIKTNRFCGQFEYHNEEQERRKRAPSEIGPRGKRFCEGCSLYHPTPKILAVKGWRCEECLARAAA